MQEKNVYCEKQKNRQRDRETDRNTEKKRVGQCMPSKRHHFLSYKDCLLSSLGLLCIHSREQPLQMCVEKAQFPERNIMQSCQFSHRPVRVCFPYTMEIFLKKNAYHSLWGKSKHQTSILLYAIVGFVKCHKLVDFSHAISIPVCQHMHVRYRV